MSRKVLVGTELPTCPSLYPQQYLLAQARPGPWEFHSGVLTSQMPEEICANIIREKLLEHLPQEIPYSVQQVWAP